MSTVLAFSSPVNNMPISSTLFSSTQRGGPRPRALKAEPGDPQASQYPAWEDGPALRLTELWNQRPPGWK